MSRAWKQWIVVACLAAAGGVAHAQERQSIVIDGSHWLSASMTERRAFLVGVGNMIVAEMAYAKKAGREAPPAGALITKAVADLKFPEIEQRITRWYEANPGRRDMPVMGVVWREIVKPRR
jgi:hypothetical protein